MDHDRALQRDFGAEAFRPVNSDRLKLEWVESWDAWGSLRGEWDELLVRSRADSIFLTWDWIASWIKVLGSRRTPLVGIVRDASTGKLCGAAVLYRTEYRLLKVLRVRALRPAADWPTGSEYPDWIAEPGQEEAVLDALARGLVERARDWDFAWMPNMRGWDGAHERLLQAGRRAGMQVRDRSTHFGFLQLPKTIAEYEGLLSSDRRQQLRRKRRKLLGMPGVRFERCDSAQDLDRYLEALFELNDRRWQTRDMQGTFRRKPDEAAFYRDFAPRALAAGWLRFYGITENGVLKAVQYGYCYGGAFLQLQEGFDPEFFQGSGNVLRHCVIDSCIEEGVHAYDFLGEMTDHKSRWLAEERLGYDVMMLHGKTPLSWLLAKAGIWPTGRHLVARLDAQDPSPKNS
ncbi:MAG: GNAT family N-acetyltransferase [Gammaproteobacteria bacterium]|nr:GNAT family N-acetyltransferase [Gammaproteobacteria bacterium]